MKNRSTRGAARVSAIWLIVFIVLIFVAAAFGWIAQQEATQAKKDRDDALTAKTTAEERFDVERVISLNISEVVGFLPKDEAGGRTNVDLSRAGLDTLKTTFSDIDSTVETYEDAIPVVVAQFKTSQQQVSNLQSQIKDLQSQVGSLRTSLNDVTTKKDDEIRSLQQLVSDAETRASDDRAELESRVASITADRNDKDSLLRSTRGQLDDVERSHGKDRTAWETRFNSLSSTIAFRKEPEKPDGSVLEVSKQLGIGWINRGAKHRIDRGMVFNVVSGKPGSTDIKGYARVMNVSEDKAEVSFFDVADPFQPIVAGDIIYNPLYDPEGERNAVLVGRFSGQYNEKELTLQLKDIGINVQKKLDLDTDYLIVGSELYVDEEGEPVEDPIQPSELSVYKEAQTLGTQVVSIRDVRRYFKK